MRICFLCEGYPPVGHGGIGTFTQNLARALVRAGHQVWVLARKSRNVPGAAYEEDEGVHVWRCFRPTKPLSRARIRYELFRTVAAWSRTGKIDLVEAPDCAGWVAGWPRLPIPVIVRLHGSLTYIAAELGQPVSRTAYWLEWAAFRRADFWCSVSRYAAVKTQQLFGLRGDRPMILYNPVDAPLEALARTRSKHQIVYTGGLKVNKGILSLLNAWPQVVAAVPEAELEIYGSDRPMDDGRSMQAFLISQLDPRVGKSVRFHGFADRQGIFRALQGARAAVFPSYAEAFAQAPMEAMACGCPTVYTRRTSGPELIEHNRTGLLIDPDRPDQIAKAMIRLLQDDRLAWRLGQAGRKRMEEFSTAVMVGQNEAFYQKCLDDFRRTRMQSAAPFWTRRFRSAALNPNRDPD
jgi:glycosyltransferase involved in cell wall biosynthesis